MEKIIKKILREYMEENDNDFKNLSFTEANHIISKILPQNTKYLSIEFDGGKFKAGNLAILHHLEKCHKFDPEVKFDLIEEKSEGSTEKDYSLIFKVKIKSEKIQNVINRSKNIDLSDWL